MQALLWFSAGLFTALAATALLWPWRGYASRRMALPALKWPVISGVILAAAACLLGAWRTSFDQSGAAAIGRAASTSMSATEASGHSGDSLQSALAKLEARLRSGTGTSTDWSLLAQTYEYLGRTSDAENARSHHVVAEVPAGEAANAKWPTGLVEAIMDTAPRVDPVADAAEPSPAMAAPAAAGIRQRAQQLLGAAERARAAGNYPDAKSAYEQLVALGQMSAQDWADFADVMASLNGGQLDGVPQQYIEAALRLSPTNEKALWLQASAQHADRHYAQAVASWSRLIALMPADAAQAKIYAANLAEDQRLAGAGPRLTEVSSGVALAVGGAAQLSGEVILAGALVSKVPAGSTLFIVARSLSSPGAPVAVERVQTGAWPVSFHLDDSLAMLPDRKLSTAGVVTIEARVSQSGAAASAPGDFASRAVTVDARSGQSVHLVIDHVVP
jgi:cytochrome c-type biogenesis protein CcmH/NrfG